MSRILILTRDEDRHADYVGAALREYGHEVLFWFGADMPESQTGSVFLSSDSRDEELHWHINDNADGFDGRAIDTVWMRRPAMPILSPELEPDPLHPDDRSFAENQNKIFMQWLGRSISENATWVNSISGRRRAESKILQLHLAKRVGLKIPDTYIGNDPHNIRAFIKQHASSGAIYKTIYPEHWDLKDGGRAFVPTTAMSEQDLPDDDVLRLTPGIFQKKINKNFEIRATMFGRECITIKINSQIEEATKLDWRIGDSSKLDAEPFTLPQSIVEKLWHLMDEIGIVFGCVDMICDLEGNYVFLEVNEMGQFLWVENLVPELPLLDTACHFLAGTSKPESPSYKPKVRVETQILSDVFLNREQSYASESGA